MSELLQDDGGQSNNDHGESSTDNLSPAEKAAAHSRRSFLFKLALLLNGAVGAVLAVPIIGYLLGPAKQNGAGTGAWVSLGAITQFPEGETRLAEFVSPLKHFDDGQTAKTACWVRHASDGTYQVFAVNCAHLGCPVRWFAQSKLFLCPCHGGAYYESGERASGPPERGLFEYRHKLAGELLMIHAGDMPTLATQASCGKKPLIQIAPAGSQDGSSTWQA
jgi:menaquinol-cytochrome c reductase iron-sulfur subunit